jgi:uncharacterized membrane protein
MIMLLVLAAVYIAASLFIGGDKTAKSLVTLVTNALILFAAILVIEMGFDPLSVTVIACVLVSLMTLFFQNEVNVKTRSALISVFIVIAIRFGFIFFVELRANLQGFPIGQFEIRESNGYSGDIGCDMTLMEVAVMLMVIIGAIIDVALSVTSGLYEVAENNKDLGRKDLFFSGLSIGKNILSSSINTLFFIFIAEYFTLFIQFTQYYTFAQMINSKEFCQQVISIAVSGIGCVLIIPVVSAVAASWYRGQSFFSRRK